MEVRCSYCKSKMDAEVETCPRCDTPRSTDTEPVEEGKSAPLWLWIVGIPVAFVAVVFVVSLFQVVTETPEQREAERQADIQRGADEYMEAERKADAETARNAQIAYEVYRRKNGNIR